MIYRKLQDIPSGHPAAEKLLTAVRNNRIHSAYLLHGPPGSGKLATALAFAYHLLCVSNTETPCGHCPACEKLHKLAHPDLQLLFPVNVKSSNADEAALKKGTEFYRENPFRHFRVSGNMSFFVESIREIKKNAAYPPGEGARKVLILHEVDALTDNAANAFLKLLEEPPSYMNIMMTAHNVEQVLPTIQSRTQKMYIPSMTLEKTLAIVQHYRPDAAATDLALRIGNGNLHHVFEWYENDPGPFRSQLLNFLRYVIMGKPIEIQSVIDSLKSDSKDHIQRFLDLLEYWFRDANRLKYGAGVDALINVDLSNELNKFNGRYGDAGAWAVLETIENARTQLNQNVHVGMVLTQLAVHLHRQLSRKL